MTAGRWGTGLAATGVLVATGMWAMGPGADGEHGRAGVDEHLWSGVRPVIEARLVADSRGGGYGEAVPGLRARWFCRAQAQDLEEHDGLVRAGVSTLCLEYGVRAGALLECGGARGPRVLRLRRDAGATGGYRVVSTQRPPDGAEYGRWVDAHFARRAAADGGDPMQDTALEATARDHFGLPAGAPVRAC
ncbi:hypothetical protein [Streptomyces cellostaticus]|uniref:hypothetical protein n=1 Tax=Streptomyces cellostaticus TaxID=67285 RepID=UPI0020261DB2|nr:hypothetical protein [Streptomyces cellostaticus]